MNYRHAFHAGNFADLVKHAALTVLLDLMTHADAPLTVIDTHAGAGGYDLSGEAAQRSGEAQNGIAKLMVDENAPDGFEILIAAVSRINEQGPLRLYPGSPALITAALRPQDRFIACELRPDEHALLADLLHPFDEQAEPICADGFATAPERTPGKGGVLVLIDPPYERAEDYARAVETSAAVLARNAQATIMIWLPLKDLETFDRFLRRLEAAITQPVLIVETRLRALDNPMAMNGCALAIINPHPGLTEPMGDVCQWIAQTLGTRTAQGRVWKL